MSDVPVRASVRWGLIGGAVTLYLALVGLIGRFSELHLIGQQVTLGRLFLLAPPFVIGLVATRSKVVAGEIRTATTGPASADGALAGLVAGAVIAVLVLFANALGIERVREVFLAASPDLLAFVAFGRSVFVGALLLSATGAVAGASGGLLQSLPRQVRRPILVGAATTLLMAMLQRIIPIALVQLGVDPGWLYSSVTGGLTWLGAAVVVVGSIGGAVAWARRGGRGLELGQAVRERRPGTLAALALAALLLAVLPWIVGAVISEVLGTVAVFLLLGLGLNIVVGYAGLLDLGYVAFFGFGAYTTALLTGATLNTTVGSAEPALSLGLSFYLAIPLVALLAAAVGLLIGAPVLRLRGDYLAIVTLGLGEIMSILLTSRWLQPLVGGPQGMRDITDAAIGPVSFRNPQNFYYLALAFVLLGVFVSWRLSASRIGRAWNAMREDEQVANAMGISTTRYKLLAFAIGGAVGSMGGALFAVKIGSLTPASFEILVSITALSVVILGGIGSLPGVVVGGLVLIGLPGLLREFEEYRLLIYGAVLVAIMILRPQGLVPNVRRSRELQEEERAQDKWAGDLTTADEDVAAAASPLGEGSG